LRGWDLIDLDSHFLSAFGSIGQFIRDHGYLAYASANVALYQRLAADAPASAVCALSSGFMLYPDALGEHYRALRKTIETDPLTALFIAVVRIGAMRGTNRGTAVAAGVSDAGSGAGRTENKKAVSTVHAIAITTISQ